MVYEVGEFREVINNLFFEMDNFNNIHVYKKGTMEYLDVIEVGYKIPYDEFMSRCKEYINKK